MLRLYLFGAPRIERDGEPLALRRTRALALLAYLAVARQPQARDTLLDLIWPEFDLASGRNNLRRELSILRSTLGAIGLRTDGQQVALEPGRGLWVDLAEFEGRLAEARRAPPGTAPWAAALEAAVALAPDELLAGFSLQESARFEEWQFFQREGRRQQLAEALAALVAWHGDRGAAAEAIAHARRWLALDPLHEPAQRALIRLYALSGQQSAALRQYEEGARLLAHELGVEPDAETQELAALVRSRRLAAVPAARQPEAAAGAPIPAAPEPAPLPPLAAGFVGRGREVADILRRLTDPDCRLLTLVGPGGVGKTQLALRAAHTLRDELGGGEQLADGVAFVPLLAVATLDGVVSALAAALRLEFVPGPPPREQILGALRPRRMLLVLDNVEQLPEAAALLAELLAAAPGVRLLLTSRVALSMPEEWFHPVDGLSVPPAAASAVAELARYDAVRLFEQLARRARGDFQLRSHLDAVVRLCRMVAGMPLALELAAGWLKTLTVEQVVAAIARDLDTLSSRDRSLPDRHRAMRTVFAETWQRLAAEEREALAGLSVFVGEFTPEAAQATSGAGLHVLAGLAEHALLRTTAAGGFQLHDLLRQFAAEQLPAAARAARERHAAYYLALAADGAAAPAPPGAPEPLLANLRAAWLWALGERRHDLVAPALAGVAALLRAHGSHLEGEELFALAAASAAGDGEEGAPDLAGRALIQQALCRYRMGYKASATAIVERGLGLLGEHGHEADRFHGTLLAGLIHGWQGDLDAARAQIAGALRLAEQIGAQDLATQAGLSLAWLCSSYGDYAEGRRRAEVSLASARALGDQARTGFALRMVACAASASGAYAVAERHLREGLELAEATGYTPGVAASLNGLGWALWCGGGSLDEARSLHERSLGLMRGAGDLLGVTMVLSDLAVVALDQGEVERARALSREGLAIAERLDAAMYRAQHLAALGQIATRDGDARAARSLLAEALRCALELGLWPQVAVALYAAGLLARREAEGAASPQERQERHAEAAQLLAAVAGHAAAWRVYRTRSERQLGELRALLPGALADAAVARGRALVWHSDLRPLLDRLGEPELELRAGGWGAA